MEKRERRERFQHSQMMKQRHGGRNRGNASNTNSGQENPPRGNRDNKVLPSQVPEKEVIDHTAIPDPHMFDNLKRETDDIADLTSKKHSKRQVFSYWSKYETLPNEEEDDQKIGEDYETLLRGAQIGAHFQLRYEKSWDPKKLPVQNTAFTIDLGVVASSLSCLPLYERLDLPKELFPADDLDHMERLATFCKEGNLQLSKRRGKSLEKEGLALLGLLTERSDQEFQPLRGDSLERGDGEVIEEGGDEEFNFGTPTLARDMVGPAVLKKEDSAIPPESISPPFATPVPPTTPSTGNDKEEAMPAVEEPPESSLQSLPFPGQSSHPPDVEEQRPMENNDTSSHETTAKKKSRGAKNKTNKRRSMEVESERTIPTSQSHKPFVTLNSENPSSSPESTEVTESPSVKEVLEVRPDAVTVASEKQSLPSNKMEISNASMKELESQASHAPRVSASKEAQRNQKLEERKLEHERNSMPLEKGDELDELLSLKKPAPRQQVINFAIPSSAVKASIDEDETLPVSKAVITEKKEDLEDWLDSMLED